ncbi:antibiotic biosynthesis monooxygenase family protein [Nostoc sp.]|uniref:antibiotic biosynthesis monooxygenase family protein n=1 Tax=Nostoc sp. TaxID=1180 RepID=UPI002FF53469
MLKFVEMDKLVTLQMQLDENISPVILINKFNVAPEDVDALIKAWVDDSAYMKEQPGYISTQLHRGIGESCVFINYAVWESVEDFKRAFNNPEFKAKLSHYPSSAETSPHLFQKVAVPRICVD